MDSLGLLADLVAIPGPVGQEEGVRKYLVEKLAAKGYVADQGEVEPVFQGEEALEGDRFSVDCKGNLIVYPRAQSSVTVMAHMDEIGMMVKRIHPNGEIEVVPLGGMRVWKVGEGPVLVMAGEGIPGVFGFGSVHTTDPSAASVMAEAGDLDWSCARVLTGWSRDDLVAGGVRPGTRVVIHPSRRALFEFGDLVGSYFLDDRADLAVWLMSLGDERARKASFVATVGEEVGGEGALYHLGVYGEEVCIALELGPVVPDCDVELSPVPTVWVSDSYATMAARDIEIVASVGKGLGMDLQFQALSRGGSDASIAASQGRCARAITLGIPMANTHGFEVIHRKGIDRLVDLTVALVDELV